MFVWLDLLGVGDSHALIAEGAVDAKARALAARIAAVASFMFAESEQRLLQNDGVTSSDPKSNLVRST